jgi:hypothetical protein
VNQFEQMQKMGNCEQRYLSRTQVRIWDGLASLTPLLPEQIAGVYAINALLCVYFWTLRVPR